MNFARNRYTDGKLPKLAKITGFLMGQDEKVKFIVFLLSLVLSWGLETIDIDGYR